MQQVLGIIPLMPRTHPTSRPDPVPILGEQIEILAEHLSRLRTRLYPILSQWSKHNLTSDDNFYGFALLDVLKEDIERLRASLPKEATE